MDIRKFLSKDKSKDKSKAKTKSSSKASTNGNKAPTPSKNRRKTAPISLDDDDDDDAEDFQPVLPSARRAAAASTTSKKRDRSASLNEPTASNSARNGAGFGGGAGGDEEGVEDAPPTKKKPRWVPRSDDPPNRGNKPLPIGAPDCLKGETFVITGILDSLLREECQDLVKQYGGRVVSAPSKKVTYGIVGLEPGQSKLTKLKTNKTPMIDEDELFKMISSTRTDNGNDDAKMHIEETPIVKEAPNNSLGKRNKVEKEEIEIEDDDEDDIKPIHRTKKKASQSFKGSKSSKETPKAQAKSGKKSNPASATLWVDKYKPNTPAELIGNNKLISDLRKWLTEWKQKFLHGDGLVAKLKDRKDIDQPAVLLVGPPGIGKTTAAQIVCRDAGYEPHEFNASDVRNKAGVASLAQSVMVANSLSRYLKISDGFNDKNKPKKFPKGQVLIMDEVDGMSGGDRGGGQELIRMIKKTKVPIICIANDDTSPNMRTLANNCFKLRFRRVHSNTVAKRLMDIARREGFHAMSDQVLQRLAEGCNGDIRQMINLLQSWRVSSPSLSFNDVKDRLNVEGKTVIQKSIFELSMSFFRPSGDGGANSLWARTDNYFADSDLVPLFVQENYINSIGASQSLEALADAAESIGEGDLCNAVVRGEQRWELMPACAVMSAIRPGTLVAGGLNSQPLFPSYLGNISKGNKWKRIVQGLEMKVRAVGCTTSGSTTSFRLDYIPALTTCLVSPLILTGAGGIDQVIERLDAYYLERDPDWLEILEAGVYNSGRGPLENIPTNVKTLFTKEYNARDHARSAVTGMRVGVKGEDGAVVTSSKRAEKEAIGILDDDDDLANEEQTNGEDGEEDIVNEFGKKTRKGKGKGSKSASSGSQSKTTKSSRGRTSSGSTRRGRGRGRGRGRR